MSRIFISYKRVDKEKVFKIKAQIESALGEKCWIDLDGIQSGDQFQNVIIDAIDNASIVIFMLSKNFIAPYRDEITGEINLKKQTFTEKEVMYAQRHDKRLIPISIDGTTVYDCRWLDFNCSDLDCINWEKGEERNKLISNLQKWLYPKRVEEQISLKKKLQEELPRRQKTEQEKHIRKDAKERARVEEDARKAMTNVNSSTLTADKFGTTSIANRKISKTEKNREVEIVGGKKELKERVKIVPKPMPISKQHTTPSLGSTPKQEVSSKAPAQKKDADMKIIVGFLIIFFLGIIGVICWFMSFKILIPFIIPLVGGGMIALNDSNKDS